MAWISCEFASETLRMPVEAEILVPQAKDRKDYASDNYKVIILLHGANWDRCEWLLKSNIFDLVREKPVLVFMPSGKNSFYTNTANGYKYMDFITKEIPQYIKTHFRVSSDRKDWLVAGESMGGYGAMLCGLSEPAQFGNIASFSGTLDGKTAATKLSTVKEDLIFGPIVNKRDDNISQVSGVGGKKEQEVLVASIEGTDLFSLCHNVDVDLRPNIYMNCGKQDSLYEMNMDFYNEIKDEYLVEHTFDKDGAHDFLYWNARLPEMLEWFLGPFKVSNDDHKTAEGGLL